MPVITVGEREEILREIVNEFMLPVLNKKGNDYTRYNTEAEEGSSNSNFVGLSQMIGDEYIDKYRVWSVFFLKHIQAIMTWISAREVESEAIEGRLTDSMNYLFILWSMLIEDELVDDPRGATDPKKPRTS